MPIDTSSLARLRPVQVESPLDRMSTMVSLQNAQLQGKKVQSELDDTETQRQTHQKIVEAIHSAMTPDGNIDYRKAAGLVARYDPAVAQSLETYANTQLDRRQADAKDEFNVLNGQPAPQVGAPGMHTPESQTVDTPLTAGPNLFEQIKNRTLATKAAPIASGFKQPLPAVSYPQADGGSVTLQPKSAEDIQAAADTAAAKTQAAKAAEPYTLNPGDKRFVNGKVVAEGGAKETLTPPRTVTTDQGVMQWNPVTDKYDIKVGNRPPTAAQTAQTVTPAGNWDVTGSEFLRSVPAQWRKTVEKIAHYDEDPTKVASMRGNMRETLMQWVNQVNPDYDSTLFGNRAPTRKAFTTGTQGQQINSINTAIGHIDQITKLATGLKNGSFVPGNEFYNWARTTFGSDAVTNFDTLKGALAGEVATVLSKGGATVSGIAEAEKSIRSASSPEQLAGYVKTLLPVMGSKLNALNYQYHQAMGENDPFSALSPEAKTILRKNGFDPENPLGGGTDSTTATHRYNPQTGKIEAVK